ncbi:MAG: dephospho-CoA kinase [Chitinophagales bacterium]
MFIIGLTGGIATGKSTVSEMLGQLGAVVIDGDRVAHEVMQPGESAYQKVVAHFGSEILQPNGEIDRGKLGDLIFNNPELRFTLNSIVHPVVEKAMRSTTQQLPLDTEIVVWDIPLLIETGMNHQVDEVWLVWVDEETQLERLMQRNRIPAEEALKRIRSQMSIFEKIKKSDRLIDNRGSFEETRRITTEFYHHLRRIIQSKIL